MIRNLSAVTVISLALIGSARAAEGGTEAQFLMARETSVETAFRAQLGVGWLGKPGLTGGRGSPITNYFGVEYAMTPDWEISIGLPLAGTLSKGPDDYGIGNIVIGAKYVTPFDRFRFAVGADVALPTAQTGARLGTFLRPVVSYAKDQAAISPYVAVSYIRDRLTFSLDLGNDLQIFTKSDPSRDKIEDIISYDAAVAMSIDQNLWGTVEMGGYSTISGGNKQTELYAGPGFRFQDYEMSFGVHLLAPFRQPARGVFGLLIVGDFRVIF
ncbi:MAG: transporter [Pseudomonadota bacterium]